MISKELRREAYSILYDIKGHPSMTNMDIIYSVVAGSHAFGLASLESDIDIKGIYVAPLESVCSVSYRNALENTINHNGPDEDDWEFHEVTKFIKLLLKCNPTIMEIIHVDSSLVLGGGYWADRLREITKNALSKNAVYYAFNGYAIDQIKKGIKKTLTDHLPVVDPDYACKLRTDVSDGRVSRAQDFIDVMECLMFDDDRDDVVVAYLDEHYDRKHFAHTIRLLSSGVECLRYGRMSMIPPHIDLCRSIKSGSASLTEILIAYKELKKKSEEALEITKLPDNPNIEPFNAFLLDLRVSQANKIK